MRSLLAKLQGITPDPSPTIRFRRDLVTHSSPSIPTGYDTSWQTSRLENHSSNPLLRLPNELLLEIMECLAPPDLYLVRQVSHLFAALFRYAAFSKYHQRTAEIDPATAEPSVHRLLRAYRRLRGKTAPGPHFIPGVEFNLDALRAEERDGLQYVLQRRIFCARCLAGRSQEWQGIYPRYTRGDRYVACAACMCSHRPSWFSPAQRQRRQPICVGWEGMLRICPHTLLSWPRVQGWIGAGPSRKRSVLRCRQCADAFGRHGEAPEVTYEPSRTGDAAGELRLGWKAPVHALSSGEVLTKEVMRRALKRFDELHPGLLCPHVSFDLEKLMKVFYWHRCVCFRQPSALALEYHRSDERDGLSCLCCATQNTADERRVGRFPISSIYSMSHHYTLCRQCYYRYEWTSDGGRIYLRGSLHSIGATSEISTDKDGHINKRRPSSDWLRTMDPSTYRQTEEWRHLKWCPDKTCANSTNRGTWY
ncbi:hypothetical protein CGCSCA4_v001308 [Colletotrichum siamense]|uniref:F-box domain-containing protein n=1 Tax=Colletotrichum siamense TaxID=690259 RepID=A0A9P5K9N6_COLSI|nr:hypothetical protein CGCSCA4_v001308 [Colletotrichum siamense]KAF4865195.1 hypothetical protein CGCSCA2_v001664 [Colletotrichum siamense]